MTCYKPLDAWQNRPGEKVSFKQEPHHHRKLELPCGQCIGCRLDRSQQWATRCIHEASLWNENSFITLTYDEDNVPWDGSLNKKHFQKFMKRLRWENRDKTIRFFHVGEYGEQLSRPHYHALLFNHDFDDKYLWDDTEGIYTYKSDQLEKLWPFGYSTVQDLTWETAAYCGRYCTKKITGKAAEEHYKTIQFDTGELINLEPEYITMSLKPAIGKQWYETYKGDCYPSDNIHHKGKTLKVPRYYDKLYEQDDFDEFQKIKAERRRLARLHAEDQTPERLATREQCQIRRVETLRRDYEG